MTDTVGSFCSDGLVFYYDAVGPGELGARFPTPLGITEVGAVSRLELVAEPTAKGVKLRLDHSPYDPAMHDSKGIAAGDYPMDDLVVLSPGKWRGGQVDKYITRPGTDWSTAQPGVGSWPVWLTVSGQLAAAVKGAEDEHVRDFGYAWNLSVDHVSVAAAALPPAPDLTHALGVLVDTLVSSGHAYLVPATPEALPAWGQRLRTVYLALCEQSGKRDNRNEHSPVAYKVAFRDNRLTVGLVAGPPHPDSQPYIKADEVPPVFTYASFAAYRQPAAPAPAQAAPPVRVGDRVKWREAAPPMSLNDIRVYPTPLAGEYEADAVNMPYLMKSSGGLVEAVTRADTGDYRVTVLVDLFEEPLDADDPEPPEERRTRAGVVFGQNHGYLRLWAENLVVVPT